MPKSRVAFWSKKITTNAERDKKGVATLREMGWKVFILWECELKPTKREAVLNTLIARIKEN
jgi:DNA mismatch endonuclease (patch repair protein)